MPGSTLDPNLIPGRDRQLGRGHGTDALGPSDSTDTGSDIMGGPGWDNESEIGIGLDTGTTSDPDKHASQSAGGDIGDADLSSDSDAAGTGEHASAGRDTSHADGSDIDTDRVMHLRDIADPTDDADLSDDIDDIDDPTQAEPARDADRNQTRH